MKLGHEIHYGSGKEYESLEKLIRGDLKQDSGLEGTQWRKKMWDWERDNPGVHGNPYAPMVYGAFSPAGGS